METDIKNLEEELKKILETFRGELMGIRTNRPTAKLIEDIKVDYFDQKVPIKQLGSIGIVPPREIQVNVWDKTAVGRVAKAIEEANIGITPNVQGSIVRIILPPLSEERRKDLIKLIGKISETYRIRVRSLRDDSNKKIKKLEGDGDLREDEKFKAQEKIQELVNKANQNIDEILENKTKEIKE